MADTTRPTQATLTATPGDTFVQLTWTRPTDNVGVSRVEVWMNNKWQAQVQPYTTSYKKTGLTNGTSYTFRVVAYDSAGNYTNSNSVTATPVGSTVTPTPTGTFALNNLVFEDQFTTINTTNWSLYNGPGHAGNGLRDPATWSIQSNVAGATGNCLVCTAYWDGSKIHSGGMSHKLDVPTARYEVRVRIEPDPSGQLSGVVIAWPNSPTNSAGDGEIDMWESQHATNSRTPMYSFIHYGGAANNQIYKIHNGLDGSQWHTINCERTASYIKIWIDGVLAWTVTDPVHLPDLANHLTLQLDAFSNRAFTGTVKMYVDYVKIYR